MAYEELTIFAIQRTDIKAFAHRFRTFHSKEDRDQTLKFLRENQEAKTVEFLEPVILKVIVQTDEDNQLVLDFERTG